MRGVSLATRRFEEGGDFKFQSPPAEGRVRVRCRTGEKSGSEYYVLSSAA